MKRTILLLTLTALALAGCSRDFPGMNHRAATTKQPAAHVATKATSNKTTPSPTAPASAPSKSTATHKS